MKFNKSNFPVKATSQEYEKWGKGFFKELQEDVPLLYTDALERVIAKEIIGEILGEK